MSTLNPLLPSGPSRSAERLGQAGLIPFVAGALLIWLVSDEALPYVAAALAAYGAVIVSFLGGIYWGWVMARDPSTLAEADSRSALWWGVCPSFMAWVGVMMPPHAGLVVLGLALLSCYLVDRRRYEAAGHGLWLTLRFRLTAVAMLCCFLGAAGV